MASNFEVLPFSRNNLGNIFAYSAQTKDYIVAEKDQFSYLVEYLDLLGAKTILAESKYVDRDYLTDYSKYYVQCFRNYDRHCVRIHFFQEIFTKDQFINTLEDIKTASLSSDRLQKSYLGFIVIKPLPENFIGRTCLKTCSKNSPCQFLITRPYIANLYGIRLEVKSVGYQEQDCITSACATISLWTLFQLTSQQFIHPIPAPAEITEKTSKRIPIEERAFPNPKGLTILQMLEAIRALKMESVVMSPIDDKDMMNNLYFFLRSNIPVLLGIRMYDVNSRQDYSHAVVAIGYQLSEPERSESFGKEDLCLLANHIKEIYVHDDQIGPFTVLKHTGGKNFSLWSRTDVVKHAEVTHMLVALPPQVRITFSTVFNCINLFNYLFAASFQQPKETLEWDIYLSDIATFKQDVHNSNIPASERVKILTKSLPKHLYRGRAMMNGSWISEFLFDATDIQPGNYFIGAIDYSDQAQLFLLTAKEMSSIQISSEKRRILESYINRQWTY